MPFGGVVGDDSCHRSPTKGSRGEASRAIVGVLDR